MRLSFILIFGLLLSHLSCDVTSHKKLSVKNKNGCTPGALLGTQYTSFDDLKKVLIIEYTKGIFPKVAVSHSCQGHSIRSVLHSGVTEKDFEKARDGGIQNKLMLALRSPYFVLRRDDIKRSYIMSRRMGKQFGEGDISFYDLALAFKNHIDPSAEQLYADKDFSEKGFTNTFNHIIAQVFITAIYTERLGDYIADAHERARIPELITGEFTEDQVADLGNGPLDNYVDLVNNEWGQEIGKQLDAKYKICRHTAWTDTLMSEFLNDIQSHCSWSFGIYIAPFHPEDKIVRKFAHKLNRIHQDFNTISL
ncbi:MAG: hypothetical protein HKN09_06435 [Saprospiraceae bacterium]|nr:hypothetical protein [Saprospiraceae bacterium]